MIMYNEEFKRMYINEFTTKNTVTQTIQRFNRAEKYEAELGKDLCCFTIKEIIAMLKGFSTSSFEYILITISTYKTYTMYGISQGWVADNQNHYEEIDNELIKSCLNDVFLKNKTISRQEIYEALDSLNNPCNKYMLFAIYEGLTLDELNGTADRFKDDNTAHLNSGRVIKVDPKLKYIAREAADTYTYTTYSLAEHEYVIEIELDPDDNTCIKKRVTQESTNRSLFGQLIRRRMAAVEDVTGFYFSFKSLKESGRINMIKTLMQENNIQDIETCIRKYYNDICYKYGKIASVPRYIITYGDMF